MYIDKLYNDLKNEKVLKGFFTACLGSFWVKDKNIKNTSIVLTKDALHIYNYADEDQIKLVGRLFITDYDASEFIGHRDITSKYRAYMSRYPQYDEKCKEQTQREIDRLKNE